MPRIKRKRHRQRRGWSDDHRRQLEMGWSMFNGSDDWGCPTEVTRSERRELWPDTETLAEMHEAWAELGDEIMAEYEHSLSRPWFWWIAEQGLSPNEAFAMRDDAEKYRLDELGLLTPKALANAAADPHITRGIYNDAHQRAFRRGWGWWRFTSPERRDDSRLEVQQLVDLEKRGAEVLTDRERYVMVNREDVPAYRKGCCWKLKLSAAECAVLGLSDEYLDPYAD